MFRSEDGFSKIEISRLGRNAAAQEPKKRRNICVFVFNA